MNLYAWGILPVAVNSIHAAQVGKSIPRTLLFTIATVIVIALIGSNASTRSLGGALMLVYILGVLIVNGQPVIKSLNLPSANLTGK